jgi:predicted DNA-binding transcriptional regulator AlpA
MAISSTPLGKKRAPRSSGREGVGRARDDLTKQLTLLGNASSVQIIRPKQLAAALSVDQSTVWRWMVNGVLPPVIKYGPSVKGWLLTEITTWLRQRQEAADR